MKVVKMLAPEDLRSPEVLPNDTNLGVAASGEAVAICPFATSESQNLPGMIYRTSGSEGVPSNSGGELDLLPSGEAALPDNGARETWYVETVTSRKVDGGQSSKFLAYVGKARLARQTVSFLLDLPIEIRRMIYFLLLRPDLNIFANGADWRNASWSTKVLQLSKQIYHEGREVLDCFVNTIVLRGDGQHLFRNMLAQGKPNMFHMSSGPAAAYIPRSHSELQFLRLRKVTIHVRYPVRTNHFGQNVPKFDTRSVKRLAGLRQEFRDLAAAVEKSTSLVELKLEFQTDCVEFAWCKEEPGRARPVTRASNPEMIELLLPLVIAAAHRKLLLTAEENSEFPVKWPWGPLQFINDARTLDRAPTATSAAIKGQTIETARGSYDLVTYPYLPYKLIPECRTCYANFKTEAELKAHLSTLPKHQCPFRKYQYNAVSPLAVALAARYKCLVCARGYNSRDFHDKHCEKFGHTRENWAQGIVPRFKRDNRRYRCSFWTESKPPAFPTKKEYKLLSVDR